MKRFQPQARFWNLIKPSRSILLQSLIGALVFSVLGLATSIYVGKLVDNVLPGGNLSLLNLLGHCNGYHNYIKIIAEFFPDNLYS